MIVYLNACVFIWSIEYGFSQLLGHADLRGRQRIEQQTSHRHRLHHTDGIIIIIIIIKK